MTDPKRHVLVKGGKVIDLVMPGPGYQPPKGCSLVESETANIGDAYQGGKFTAFERPVSKEQLREYVRERRNGSLNTDLDFNLAEPGNDPVIIQIPMSTIFRGEIIDLAWLAEVTGEDTTLVIRDRVLTLTPKQIMAIRERIAEHIRRSHRVAAKLLEGVEKASIPSLREIDKPETATAIKIDPWVKKYG
jgi:hypothetical protein